jgi:hypothetical protein
MPVSTTLQSTVLKQGPLELWERGAWVARHAEVCLRTPDEPSEGDTGCLAYRLKPARRELGMLELASALLSEAEQPDSGGFALPAAPPAAQPFPPAAPQFFELPAAKKATTAASHSGAQSARSRSHPRASACYAGGRFCWTIYGPTGVGMTWAARTAQSRLDWLIELRVNGLEIDPISPPAPAIQALVEPTVTERRKVARAVPARSPPKKKATRKSPKRKAAVPSTPSKASSGGGSKGGRGSSSLKLTKAQEGVPPSATRLPPRKKKGRNSPGGAAPAGKPKRSSASTKKSAAKKKPAERPVEKQAKQPSAQAGKKSRPAYAVEKEGWLQKLKEGVWKRRYCELIATASDERFLVYRAKPEKRELWRVLLNGAVLEEGDPSGAATPPPSAEGTDDAGAYVWTVYDRAGEAFTFAAAD